MKTTKYLSVIAFVMSLYCSGCSNLPAVIEAASHDPASVHVDVVTVYGHITYDRNLPASHAP